MRRHEYQLASSGTEDARKPFRRSRQPDLYSVEVESFDVDTRPELPRLHHESHAVPESMKIVYLEAMESLLRDRLQLTWGRVQQQEEMEYERIVEHFTRMRQNRKPAISGNILEAFEGFVDKFEGDVAYVTLKTASGEKIYGEYPASELKVKGIREFRRFKCWTVEVGSCVEFVMESISDQELSEQRERELNEWLLKSLGDDDAPQNDY